MIEMYGGTVRPSYLALCIPLSSAKLVLQAPPAPCSSNAVLNIWDNWLEHQATHLLLPDGAGILAEASL